MWVAEPHQTIFLLTNVNVSCSVINLYISNKNVDNHSVVNYKVGGKSLSVDECSLQLPSIYMTKPIKHPIKYNKLVFLACKTTNINFKKQHTPNRQCSVRWINAWKRDEECFYISVHYGFQYGPFVMMCAESRKRAIKVTTVFPTAKELTQQLLKEKTTQLKNEYDIPLARQNSVNICWILPILRWIH